ncbi:MAG: hypothetical protein M3Y12_09725 [Bacteroidota bacterium]|nr:hypothetical protein [Bacteroidota bacterium]
MSYLTVVGWLGLALFPLPTQAQTPPPRFEQRLPRVAPPPGRLLPYRRGERWGYADSTGRVVVAPVLRAAPLFSPAGVVRVDTS